MSGTIGSQAFANGYGMDFDVRTNIVISTLGVFDSGGNGIASTLTVQLYRIAPSVQMLASLVFGGSGSGTLASGTASRMKPLTTPLVLQPGSYSIVSYGHNATDLNGNAGLQTKVWTTDNGGGLITFTGSSRYGGVPGTLPPNHDSSADQYAAGNDAERRSCKAGVLGRDDDLLHLAVGQLERPRLGMERDFIDPGAVHDQRLANAHRRQCRGDPAQHP